MMEGCLERRGKKEERGEGCVVSRFSEKSVSDQFLKIGIIKETFKSVMSRKYTGHARTYTVNKREKS